MKQRLTNKYTILSVIFTTVILFAFSGSHPTTNSGGYTGAPNDNVCTACHTPGGSLDGTIEITGLPSLVTANTTYPLTVTITDTSTGGVAAKAGFQLVSLKSNLANGGTFTSASGETNTAVKTVSSKSYIGHEPAKSFGSNNIVTYDIEWTSPANADDNITIYGASMIVNGADGNSNDKFVTTNVITEIDVSSSVNEEIIFASLYPNPVTDILTIEVSRKLITAPKVYSASGQSIDVSIALLNGSYQLDVSKLKSGFYYVKLETEIGSEMKKIVVRR